MPIYEYKCSECGHEFEVMQKMNDEPIDICEKSDCDGPVEKLISRSSFALKGTGWYQTDYAKKEEKKCEPVAESCSGCPSAK